METHWFKTQKLGWAMFAAAALAPVAAAPADAPGFSMVLTAALTNETDHQILLSNDSPHEVNFRYNVRGASGETPPKTRRYRQLTGDRNGKDAVELPDPRLVFPRQGNRGPTGILPGKTLKFYIDLSSLFDLSQPDTYTIQVSWFDWDGSVGLVTSSPITVTVTAAESGGK